MGRDKNPGQNQADRLVVGEFLPTQRAIKRDEFLPLVRRKRPSVGPIRDLEERGEVRRLALPQLLAKRRGAKPLMELQQKP
jgi:hypothetical protein